MPLSSYRVGEAMRRDPDTIPPGQTLRDALRAIGSTRYACFVAVDDGGHPVGILTAEDLVRLVVSEQVPGGKHLRHILASPEALIEHSRTVHAAAAGRVADCMSTPVVTIEESATLNDAAELLEEHDIRQLPVVKGGVLVGLIRRVDMVEPLMRVHEERNRERHAGQGVPEPSSRPPT